MESLNDLLWDVNEEDEEISQNAVEDLIRVCLTLSCGVGATSQCAPTSPLKC